MALRLVLVVLLVPAGARAGIEDTYGLGSRATALGGAMCALADDFSATFYNPAGLALTEAALSDAELAGLSIHLGVVTTHPSLGLKRGRVEGGELVFDGDPTATSAVDHTLDGSTGLTIGAAFDLGRIVGLGGFHLGLALYVPASRAFQWDIQGGETLQWPLYLDRTQRMSILPALSLRPHPKVAIGLGARITVDSQTNSETVVAQGTDGELITELGNAATIGANAAPTAGILVQPTDWLRVGVTVRGELITGDFGYTDVDATGLGGIGSFGYTHDFTRFYTPLEVAGGVALRFGDWRVALDATWSAWSGYLDSRRDDYDSTIARDVVTPRVGLEWQAHRSTRLMAGWFYHSSPFRNDLGWTNFVDNDKHVTSIGTQTDLRALLATLPSVRIAWHAQVHVLRPRNEVKDGSLFRDEAEATANPGWPGWRSDGWIVNVGISLDADF